jgi:hypothetical protein
MRTARLGTYSGDPGSIGAGLCRILHPDFREFLPTFIWVVQAHILDDAHEGPRMAQNSSPLEMAVEESPLGPLWRSRPLR